MTRVRSVFVRAAAIVCVLGMAPSTALAASPVPAKSGNLLTVRFGGNSAETRVVIEMTRAVHGQLIAAAGQSNRVILALPDLILDNEMQGGGAGLVQSWGVDEAAGAARLRLTLTKPGTVRRRFLLPPGQGNENYRYVMDIVPNDAAAGYVVAAPDVMAAPAAVAAQKSQTAIAAQKLPAAVSAQKPQTAVSAQKPKTVPGNSVMAVSRPLGGQKATPVRRMTTAAPQRVRKIVVIDAGHGGHDPGAKGADHWEKDVNLAAALALKARLERSGDYKVVLTRSSDVFIPLDQRVQIARSANADLFISLHSDSGPNDQTRGASVYTLSDKGSDRAAKSMISKNDWLIDANLPSQDKAVKQILFDLTQRETKNRSANFAQILLDHINDDVPLLARSHRDAGFAVLLAPDVPAVLLEMGFITNRLDESLLGEDQSRQDFMDSVGDSIDAYFDQGMHLASR